MDLSIRKIYRRVEWESRLRINVMFMRESFLDGIYYPLNILTANTGDVFLRHINGIIR